MHELVEIQARGRVYFFSQCRACRCLTCPASSRTSFQRTIGSSWTAALGAGFLKDAGKSAGLKWTGSFKLQCFISGYLFNSLQIPKACYRKQHCTIADRRETKPKRDIIGAFYTFFCSFVALAAISVSVCSSGKLIGRAGLALGSLLVNSAEGCSVVGCCSSWNTF